MYQVVNMTDEEKFNMYMNIEKEALINMLITSNNYLNMLVANPNYDTMQRITRVEVVDTTGRAYVNWHRTNNVQLDLQDDGRTLKVFITKDKNE